MVRTSSVGRASLRTCAAAPAWMAPKSSSSPRRWPSTTTGEPGHSRRSRWIELTTDVMDRSVSMRMTSGGSSLMRSMAASISAVSPMICRSGSTLTISRRSARTSACCSTSTTRMVRSGALVLRSLGTLSPSRRRLQAFGNRMRLSIPRTDDHRANLWNEEVLGPAAKSTANGYTRGTRCTFRVDFRCVRAPGAGASGAGSAGSRGPRGLPISVGGVS